MSTRKAPQTSRSSIDSYSPEVRAKPQSEANLQLRGNPLLPFDQNQTRQFFEAVKILLEKLANPEKGPVKVP